MNTEIIDTPEVTTADDVSLKSALSWWEKKRIWYNIFVGASGVLPILFYANSFSFTDFIGLVFYGLLLNVFYSTGFLLEAFNLHYFKQRFGLKIFRFPLFVVGVITSCVVTFIGTIIYYSW